MKRMVRAALLLYPKAWRERYGEEFAAMLEAREVTVRDVFDIVRGALREQMWPSVRAVDSGGAALGRFFAGFFVVSALLAVTPFDWFYVNNVGVMMGPWQVAPFVGAFVSFVLLRKVFGANRGRFAAAATVWSILVGLAWMWILIADSVALHNLSEGRPRRLTPFPMDMAQQIGLDYALGPCAVAFALQAIFAFLLLDRRRREDTRIAR